ncbi:hypothetical protein ElyMa_006343700 [Elysia marginata]|uniref:Uncharacterized protein n=1 Tax=Elysia marginata TaxID=1093978 RepID=A0AAV4HNN2_9GAST|nr:hypothetical protein ElyMa_006343700 [Elysia marginata]
MTVLSRADLGSCFPISSSVPMLGFIYSVKNKSIHADILERTALNHKVPYSMWSGYNPDLTTCGRWFLSRWSNGSRNVNAFHLLNSSGFRSKGPID